MQISINGKPETIDASTVSDVLKVKEIDPQLVAVELNTEVIEREHMTTTTVKDGDKLEFLFLWVAVSERTPVNSHYRRYWIDPVGSIESSLPPGGATIYGKAEFYNPGGSVKDRICLNMIDEAESQGRLKPGGTIVEPTSGNTGIGLALVSAVRGYKLILVMPEGMSLERASLLSSYGAQLVLTPAREGMRGSIKEAESILSQNPEYFMPDQFSNQANPAVHKKTTAPEIWEALNGKVDAFVAAVGTGGTITGCGEYFKEHNPSAKIIAVEPTGSPVLSGGEPGPHRIQGIGAGFIPTVLNRTIVDEIMTVSDEEAYQYTKQLAKKEGLLVGISAGANVFAAQKVAAQMQPDQHVVTVLCDTGERYLSMEKYFNI